MNYWLVLGLLALFPICSGLNCYVCTGGTNGCNDPFSSTGSGVSTYSSSLYQYCVKTSVSSVVTRGGASSCIATTYVSGSGVSCCQTDLCNGASSNFKAPILSFLFIVTIIWQFY